MNTLGSLFNDLCLFKFMSAMHYSFSMYQSFALWVKFSHNILLFYDIIIALFSSFTFWNVHFNRSTTDFYMSILYLQICWISLLVILWNIWRFLHVRSYYPRTEIILQLPYQFGWFYFIFLPSCSGLELPTHVE